MLPVIVIPCIDPEANSSYEFISRFSRSLELRIGGSSRLNSFEVISPARNASQRLLMRSCVWVRDLRVASLHFAESVFLLVAKADLILFLSFLISPMFLPPRILDWCVKKNVKQKLKNPMIVSRWKSPDRGQGESLIRSAQLWPGQIRSP